MADVTVFEEVIAMAQAALQDTDAETVVGIKTAVGLAWAELAEEGDWWFLRQNTPYPLPLVANQATYALAQSKIGRILYISESEYSKPLYIMRDWHDANLDRDAQSELYSSAPMLITSRGIGDNSRRVIELYPAPSETQTVCLHFTEAGDDGNIDRLPRSRIRALFHLTMVSLAQPKKIDQFKWGQISQYHNQRYLEALAAMKAKESWIPFYRRANEVDPDLEAELRSAERATS